MSNDYESVMSKFKERLAMEAEARKSGKPVVVAAQKGPQMEFEIPTIKDLEVFLGMTPWFSIGRVWTIRNPANKKGLVMVRNPKTISWSGRTRLISDIWLEQFGVRALMLTAEEAASVRAFVYDTWCEID